MSVTFDATPGSAAANSYCTVALADDFLLTQRLHATRWAACTQAEKEAALMWATYLLDVAMRWKGTPASLDQALRWPRVAVMRPDDFGEYAYTTIPDVLARGTAEFALALVARDRTAEPDVLGLGMSQIGVGKTRVVIDKDQVLGLLPSPVAAMLDPIGMVDNGGGTGGVARLVRS